MLSKLKPLQLEKKEKANVVNINTFYVESSNKLIKER